MTLRAADLEPRLIAFNSSANELRWYGMAILFYRTKPVAVFFLQTQYLCMLNDELYTAYERRTIFQWLRLNYPIIEQTNHCSSEELLELHINQQVAYGSRLDKSPQMCDITMSRNSI